VKRREKEREALPTPIITHRQTKIASSQEPREKRREEKRRELEREMYTYTQDTDTYQRRVLLCCLTKEDSLRVGVGCGGGEG
jgi:hypothetical protein